jgi:hypothetical protein
MKNGLARKIYADCWGRTTADQKILPQILPNHKRNRILNQSNRR